MIVLMRQFKVKCAEQSGINEKTRQALIPPVIILKEVKEDLTAMKRKVKFTVSTVPYKK